MAKKKQQNKKPQTINVDIPKIQKGNQVLLTNLDGNYIISEFDKSDMVQPLTIEQAEYDIRKVEHLYNQIFNNESSSTMTTPEELSNLAKNTQSDINKIKKING